MPAEKFWSSDHLHSNGGEPVLTVSWGHPAPGEVVTPLITSTGPLLFAGGDVEDVDRLIKALKRARRAMLGKTTREDMAVDSTLSD